MEDEGILAEIDCSKTYSQGQAFQVVYSKYNMYEIQFKEKGLLPSPLNGKYTSVPKAVTAINTYIIGREDHFTMVARRKAVKKSVKRLQKEES